MLQYYPGICLEVLRKPKKILSQGIRYHGQDLNQSPPEYEPEAISLNHSLLFVTQLNGNVLQCSLTIWSDVSYTTVSPYAGQGFVAYL
jgi:hypothetical protein